MSVNVNSQEAKDWSDMMRRISAKDHALVLAREKIAAYYAATGGSYPGGPLYQDVMATINSALEQ